MSGTRHALDRFGAGVLHRTGARGLLHRVGLPSASTEPLPSDSAEVAHLLRAPAFQSQVRDLAERLGRSEEDVLAEAASALREMSAMHDEAVIAQWQRFGRWMRRGYDTLLDEEKLYSEEEVAVILGMPVGEVGAELARVNPSRMRLRDGVKPYHRGYLIMNYIAEHRSEWLEDGIAEYKSEWLEDD